MRCNGSREPCHKAGGPDCAGEAPVHAQLPASFFAYRKQQHRWTCGPVQLWRRAAVDIWASSLPMSAKLELIVAYFGIRKFATHWVSLGFFCTLVPLSMFTPEVSASNAGDLPAACHPPTRCNACSNCHCWSSGLNLGAARLCYSLRSLAGLTLTIS